MSTYAGPSTDLAALLSGEVMARLDQSLRRGAKDERLEEVAFLVHELASPLTAALGYQDLVLEDTALPEGVREQLLVARRECKRAHEVVEDILDVLRPAREHEEQETQKVDLVAVVKECLDGLYPQVRAKHQTLHAELDPVLVCGQEKELSRLVYNLVGNAIKYTPEGGQVEVRLRYQPGDKRALLTVVDDGVGIPKDELPLIGSRFFRARTAKAPGHGLGLAYCREVAAAHGGEVHIASEEGTGTSFAVDLPVVEPAGATWNRDKAA